ncbi:MAG: RIO1 family regulatory kinase/ATPase [Candidatus Hermodarchaeota archaeon]
MTKEIFNQKKGLEFLKNGPYINEDKQNRQLNQKVQLREITVANASKQLLATGKIKKIISVIGAGKEATVLLAQDKETNELVCAKVFRYFTSTVRKRLQGTYHISKEEMASIGAKQEYWNLYELHKVNIPVPKPRYLLKNIIIMDFIRIRKDSLVPAPLLSDVNISEIDDPEYILYKAIDIIARIFLEGKMIHGDYSNDNLMITENGLVTMDVSQSMIYNQKTFIDTPIRIRIDKAAGFLLTDLRNLNKGFTKYWISIDPKEVCQNILKSLPEKLQGFLKNAEYALSISNFVPERYKSKEMARESEFQRRTKRKYQIKKK